MGHEPINFPLRHGCIGQEICQFKASKSLITKKKVNPTISRFAAGIGHPRTFEGQPLPMTKGANSPKMKFFDAMASLETGLTEFSHTLDQSEQALIHWWFCPLIFDDRGE
jgi:hypothetical protein